MQFHYDVMMFLKITTVVYLCFPVKLQKKELFL